MFLRAREDREGQKKGKKVCLGKLRCVKLLHLIALHFYSLLYIKIFFFTGGFADYTYFDDMWNKTNTPLFFLYHKSVLTASHKSASNILMIKLAD